jgi:hypothetical protein
MNTIAVRSWENYHHVNLVRSILWMPYRRSQADRLTTRHGTMRLEKGRNLG